jgi:murein DD-endopeptidase MepM/ murein hydrolase activator NlpD
MQKNSPPSPLSPVRHLLVLTGAGLFLALGTALGLSKTAVSGQTTGAAAGQAAGVAAAIQAVGPEGPIPVGAIQPAEPAPLVAALPAEVAAGAAELDDRAASGRPLIKGEIRDGDTLGGSFVRAGAPRDAALRVARLMKVQFDFQRQARPGHFWELLLASDGRVEDFRYWTSGLEGYRLRFDADGLPEVVHENVQLAPRVTRLEGTVQTTLYDAVERLGEDPQLARDFAEIFAWDLDFSRSVRPGDRFAMLYERLYRVEEDGTETYLHPGLVLAAEYAGDAGEHTAVYFETEEGRGGYYRPDGTSVRGQFLKAPLRFVKISSSYSSARLHPILKIKRPHHGIDYAAPTGEPVWSVADGKIIYRGWAGGFGNLVKVRHSNGYVSYYAHLSRFARGLRVGSRVQQKQVIGYVGKTGLATGPHVCFRVAQDGRFVNPTAIKLPSGQPIPDEVRTVFDDTRDLLLAELEAGTLLAKREPLEP